MTPLLFFTNLYGKGARPKPVTFQTRMLLSCSPYFQYALTFTLIEGLINHNICSKHYLEFLLLKLFKGMCLFGVTGNHNANFKYTFHILTFTSFKLPHKLMPYSNPFSSVFFPYFSSGEARALVKIKRAYFPANTVNRCHLARALPGTCHNGA